MLNISKLKLNNFNNNSLVNKGELVNKIKYYPSSTKEWLNSIYTYYKNEEKNIFNLDTIVYKIIISYFNMYSSRLDKSIFLRKKTLIKRRYKLNNILISKPEFKHTNDKVKIILYVYNTELSFLNLKINNLKKKIFAQYFYKIFTTKYITLSKLYTIKILLKRIKILKLYIKNFKELRNRYLKKLNNNYIIGSNTIINYYQEWSFLQLQFLSRKKSMLRIKSAINRFERNGNKIRNVIKKKLSKIPKNKLKNLNLMEKYMKVRLLNKSLKIVQFLFILLNKFNNKTHKTTIKFYNDHIKNMPIFSISKNFYINSLKKMVYRLRLLLRYNKIITFNKLKFNTFLNPLKFFLEKIYKKDIEFDIITVKNYRLNSSLLTQVLAIKLRNRKNRIVKLLNKIINPLKLPISKRHEYFKGTSKKRLLQNIILKQNIKKNFVLRKPIVELQFLDEQIKEKKLEIEVNKLYYIKNKGDKLDLLLKLIYPKENTIINNNILELINNIKILSKKLLIERNLENIILDSIKNKAINGIKIQGSGRLTKRAVAARSSLKIIQKGTMKDINSSYKKLSTILLKGNLKSNLQYTVTNGKTRIGSFGIKGWISSI